MRGPEPLGKLERGGPGIHEWGASVRLRVRCARICDLRGACIYRVMEEDTLHPKLNFPYVCLY
jgi:hypothetical protein